MDESIRTIEDDLWSWASTGLVVYLIMVVVEVVSMTVDEVHAPFHHGNHKFFKCTPPLKKLLHQTNQEGEMVGLTEQITWEPVDNEHPVLHWCS